MYDKRMIKRRKALHHTLTLVYKGGMDVSNNHHHVAVLGAGISGLCCAYALQAAGYDVTIYDPAGFPAHNASFIAGGMLAPYSEIDHMDMTWVRAGVSAIDLWKSIAGTLGADIEFSQEGSILVSHAKDAHMLDRFTAHLPHDAMTVCKANELEADIVFDRGVYLPQEAHLHPQKTMQALCVYLSERVHMIAENKSMQQAQAEFDEVIDCRGLASESQASELRGVKGETAIVRNPEFSLLRPVRIMHPRYPLYVVPRADHVFMIGATVIESDANETVSVKSSMELMSALYMLHPSFGEAEIIEFQAGLRPSYRDNLPRVSVTDGVVSVNGMYRHGYLFAPIMANAVVKALENPSCKGDILLDFIKDDNDDAYLDCA
jgi:glycine oxidase